MSCYSVMNPCPCGHLGHPKRECTCSFLQVQRYRSKISGPLMDRIDIHLEVPSVPYKDLSSVQEGAGSREIAERVCRAREIQTNRFKKKGPHSNGSMNNRAIKKFCEIDAESSTLLEKAMERFGLSARAHARILKIARTIADLEESPDIGSPHVAEAIQYRSLDRKVLR
jgi:magnesium chelatase family protein